MTPGALSKIDHIVVLMQENRSFDQLLGYLSRDGMLPREKLLSGDESAGREPPQANVSGLLPGDNNRDANEFEGRTYRSRRTRTTAWPSFSLNNPSHGHDDIEHQITDSMKGFVANYAAQGGRNPDQLQLIMDYVTDAELPAYGALTREFAVCDHWHCSYISGTLPNRFISLTGDFSKDVYGSPEVENPHLSGGFAPLETPTFLDHLSSRGVEWRLFEHGYSTLRMFREHTFDETNITGFNDEDSGFAATARAGKLPPVSFIEPDYIEAPDGNDDHAPADLMNGQRMIAGIVRALVDSPQWDKTLLIITYDEHGGFYDHMPLPTAISRTVDGVTTTRPIQPLSNGDPRFGVRVPAFVVSPYIPSMPDGKVNVAHTTFDHTTIPATILRRFCAPFPPDMGPRVREAADLGELLTLDTPRPRSDFNQLAAEMSQVAARPAVPAMGKHPAAPLRKPEPEHMEDDFHGLIAFASSVTGRGRR